ncbi:MAG: tetratricopeptide (TPR) repeat protein [Enterobacterales bacterium]|jgi:tetratricopeptide (TPR) repeat protein
MGKTKDSRLLLSQLVKNNYKDSKTYSELALLYGKLEDYKTAKTLYEKAIHITSNDSQLYFNLASIQRYLGKIKDAEVSLDKAIDLNPLDCEAYLLRSSLTKQSSENNHISEMKSVLLKGINNPTHYAQLSFALAKEYEDLEQFDKSFSHLNKGADYRRRNMQYDPKNDLETINNIIDAFDSEIFEQNKNDYNNNEAIFILGLPRTGSTLVERIIGSHNEVYSAGELNNFALQMMEQCKKVQQQAPKSRAELVQLTTQLKFSELGTAYIDSTRPNTAQNKRFIDKLPLNSLYVGLIHLALPKAKIIHVKRHPLDTCYSIYKQLFTNGYPFSYNLKELADYYIANHKLMEHWNSVIPDAIYTINYEQLIDNFEDESKQLIAHCQLDWQEQCLQFYQNKQASVTASASQVRQPIYRSSIAKWRNFEKQLNPIKKQLEQAGISCD